MQDFLNENSTNCILYALLADSNFLNKKNGNTTATTTTTTTPPNTQNTTTTTTTVGDNNDDPTLQSRFEAVISIGEECLESKELFELMRKKKTFRLYDGFEPSGRMHIAQGVFKSINVNTCTENGGEFVFWVADFFALMNDKMGGSLDAIKTVGEYLVHVWRAAGMNMTNVKFIWASEEIVARADEYARYVVDIARRFSVVRLTKCCQIMGRKEGNLSAAQVLYPIMQATDIFFLRADVCQLGLDQRKVNMLARDYCQAAGRRFKPVILSHHMLFGLKEGQEKMSKSDPDSAIFMEDTVADVQRKISAAFCPIPKETSDVNVDKNPCLDYIKYICLTSSKSHQFLQYSSIGEIKSALIKGELTETTLKTELARIINELLEPVRKHFLENEDAKTLLDRVKELKKQATERDAQKAAKIAAKQDALKQDGNNNNINAAAAAAAAAVDDEGMEEAGISSRAAAIIAARRGGGGGSNEPPALPKLRRLEMKILNGQKSIVVFAPRPISNTEPRLTVSLILGVVIRLNRAKAKAKMLMEEQQKSNTNTQQLPISVVLFIEDLGTVALGCLADPPDMKARKIDDKTCSYAEVGKKSSPTMEIDAFYEAMLSTLQSLGALTEDIHVIWQSKAMLEDPMNYWISVINVGRAFKLNQILDAVGLPALVVGGGGNDDEDNVGNNNTTGNAAGSGRVGAVIDALMHVAHVLACGPAIEIFCDPSQKQLHELSQLFFQSEFTEEFDISKIPFPNVLVVEAPLLRMFKTIEEGNSISTTTTTTTTTTYEDDLFVGETDKQIGTKIKRAFCQIGNIAFNPVLNGIVGMFEIPEIRDLIFGVGKPFHIKISRKLENGGNIEFKSCNEVAQAFSKGVEQGSFPPDALHPSDLKEAMIPIVSQFIAKFKIKDGEKKILDACKKRLSG
jgi:tyrosyl-tRNA synthetase